MIRCKLTVLILVSIILAAGTISCISVSKLKYFNDIDNLEEPVANPKEQKVIMPFDKLFLKIYSIDEKTNMLFNTSANVPGNATSVVGYLVDEKGNIDYPFVGKINVGGLTLAQAEAKVSKALGEYVTNAAVDIKFMDNSITVLGEVQRAGAYSFSQSKINIYEALGLGGGITQYGDHKKVILIRQEGDKIMHHKLDLSDSNIASKEYYYVLNNDVIIVEPLRATTWYRFNASTFSTALSSLAFLISFYLAFIKK